MPRHYQLYINFYWLSLMAFTAAVIWPVLEIPYALLFFGLTANLIFTRRDAIRDAEHSTATHFDAKSRMNWFNYLVSAYLVISSLIFVLTPVNRALTILVLWSVFVFALYRLLNTAMTELYIDILTDYVMEQMPHLSKQDAKQGVMLVLKDKAPKDSKLEHYVKTYLENNFDQPPL